MKGPGHITRSRGAEAKGETSKPKDTTKSITFRWSGASTDRFQACLWLPMDKAHAEG